MSEKVLGVQGQDLLVLLWERMIRTLDRSSVASLGDRTPARSRTDFLPASRFIMSVKLSFGPFLAVSLA
jgi:hypothetical protein